MNEKAEKFRHNKNGYKNKVMIIVVISIFFIYIFPPALVVEDIYHLLVSNF